MGLFDCETSNFIAPGSYTPWCHSLLNSTAEFPFIWLFDCELVHCDCPREIPADEQGSCTVKHCFESTPNLQIPYTGSRFCWFHVRVTTQSDWVTLLLPYLLIVYYKSMSHIMLCTVTMLFGQLSKVRRLTSCVWATQLHRVIIHWFYATKPHSVLFST